MENAAATTEIEYPEVDLSGVNENADIDGVTDDTAGEDDTPIEADESGKTEGTEEEGKEPPKEKPKQTPEENAKWAAKRREWEEKSKASNDKLNNILKPFGAKNYEELSSMAGVEIDDTTIERLSLEALEKGIDEEFYIDNYKTKKNLELFKAQAEAKKADLAKKETDSARVKENVDEFKTLYPGVDIEELFKDETFVEINEGLWDKKTLVECYERHLKYSSRVDEAAKDKAARILAKKNAAVGSLQGNATTGGEFYTLDELKKMSKSELDRNWSKVEKSYARIMKN